MNLNKLCDIAIKAARSAGKLIQQSVEKNITVRRKLGAENYGAQVVTEIDYAAEKIILDHLLPSCEEYDLALLSEEREDDGSRFEKAYFWCIDPMDGTLAFINKKPGYSVSIALVSKDGTPHIGVVYNPVTDTLYHAIKGEGTFKNNNILKLKSDNSCLSYFTDKKMESNKRSEDIKQLIAETLKKLGLGQYQEISGAGAVLNCIQVLENGPACMFKFPKPDKGGGCIWDYAAVICIYNELNLTATDFNGAAIELNKVGDAYMNEKGVFFSNF